MMLLHAHRFKFECRTSQGHRHTVFGQTEGTVGIGAVHVHFYSGTSTYTNHTHSFSGTTGFPHKTPGGHSHPIEGELDPNHYHKHVFSDFTGDDTESTLKARPKEIFGH